MPSSINRPLALLASLFALLFLSTLPPFTNAGIVPAFFQDEADNTTSSLDFDEDEGVLSARAAPGPPSVGRWGKVINLPLIPVAAALIPNPDGSPPWMFMYSAYNEYKFGVDKRYTKSLWFNFRNGQIVRDTIDETGHDMFCPGMSYDQDGRLVVTGGSNAEVTSIYDSLARTWTRAANMIIPRGYQTSTLTSQNKVFTIGGSWEGGVFIKNGEVYNPRANNWRKLPGAKSKPALTADAEGLYRSDNHAWLYGWRNGWVFQAGPSHDMHWYDTKGAGKTKFAGNRVNDGQDQMCGANVMYDSGKILSAGGSQSYINSPGVADTHVISIGRPNRGANSRPVAPMANPRAYPNAVVLPDGQVLVTGGQRYAKQFTDEQSILTPELWNPATERWTSMAPMTVPRNYHSVSVLLPDGRVFVGGGGLCYDGWTAAQCPPGGDHPDGQIFSPPYLFRGSRRAWRPKIKNLSSHNVPLGGQFTATMAPKPKNRLTFSLVRFGSATHSVNSDQRRVALEPKAVNGNTYTFALDDYSGALLPGYWMFFAMNNGVPSVSQSIQILG